MQLIVVGPGRAGRSIAIAAEAAGHDIVGVVARRSVDVPWPQLDAKSVLPPVDLVLIAVSDDAIEPVSRSLAASLAKVAVVAHLSGFVPVGVLQHLQSYDISIGGFHPLQSLPDPVTGAGALREAFVGVDGDQDAIEALTRLAVTLGMTPFRLDDDVRPAYHAAAAAASNFVVSSLAISADLFDAAGIDPGVSRPLVDRAVANVFEKGAGASLTGPIARGDIATVVGHLGVASDISKTLGRQFRLMAEATALRAGRGEDVQKWT